MSTPESKNPFVGIQVSPISFVDEGVDTVLDTLQNRVGVNVLMLENEISDRCFGSIPLKADL